MTQRQHRGKGSGLRSLVLLVLLVLAIVLAVLACQKKQEYQVLVKTTPVPSLAPPNLAYRQLAPLYRYGSSGPEVIALQQRLAQLGYYTQEIDGKYYEGTQAAVKAFQLQHNLDADGIAGEKTLAVLDSDQAQPYQTPQTTQSPSAAPGSYTTPKP